MNHIKNLVTKDESLYLEFKSKWYWEKEEKGTVNQWGEFLKDFVALLNCNVDYVESTKYLIIGVDEKQQDLKKRILPINIESNKYPTLDSFKRQLLTKIKSFFYIESNSELTIDFTLSYQKVNSIQILVFEIKPTKNILILKKDLQVKTRTETKNHVFIRALKNNNEPQVIHASPKTLKELNKKIDLYAKKIEDEEKKEKSIEKTVELFIQKNQNFSLDERKIQKEKKRTNGIVYEFYPVRSDFANIDFIYISDKTNQIQTAKYLNEKKIVSSNVKRWIFIDYGLKKNITSITNKFDADKVFSLDEFALEYLYKDYLNETIYHDGNFKKHDEIKNFVEPFTTNSQDKNAFIILSEWFNSNSKPLMVIKGYGGVGKTTLVKYFLDDIYMKSKNKNKILFIDSKSILSEIAKGGKVDNIFDFYSALAHKEQLSKRFNKELLELSLDNGNLLLVLDGIDEVIAKLGSNFNIKKFISTIYENYSMGSQKTKIIITCRDYFWDKSMKNNDKISTLELKAFNKELAKKFFLKNFQKGSNPFQKSIEYADEFALLNGEENSEETEDIYIPYILDVIVDIVKQNKELGVANVEDIETNLLNRYIKNDYFVGRICNREIEKLNNLNIDSQLHFFINMSVKLDGKANIASKNKLFRDLPVRVSEEMMEKFKGHPLISFYENTFHFRYDFFKEYFMNLYISDILIKKDEENISDDFKELIKEYIKYDNSFTKFVCQRLTFNEELQIFIIELIERWINLLKDKEDYEVRQLISSMIIILMVSLNLSTEKKDKEIRTQLLVDTFGENLEYLSLINLFSEEKQSNEPIFNFRNKKIINAYFDNYGYFWECNINDSTEYYGCTFKHLNPRKGVNIPKLYKKLHKKLFIDCNTLGIDEILKVEDNEIENELENIKEKLVKIFNLFEMRGTFKEQKQDDIRNKCTNYKAIDILDTLLKNKIINKYINPAKPTMKQYRVSDEYFNICKILNQRGTNIQFEKVLKFF